MCVEKGSKNLLCHTVKPYSNATMVGKCNCNQNVDGDKCDKCVDGYSEWPQCDQCADKFWSSSESCIGNHFISLFIKSRFILIL